MQDIEICPIEISGHGTRMLEKCLRDVESCAEDIAMEILNRNEECDYAIWGHSLGAVIAFEVYYKLLEKGAEGPKHMFFSGRKAPQDKSEKTAYYKLPDEEFAIAVQEYGGNVKEAMKHKELRDLFLPILKADFEMGETYEMKKKDQKLSCDITIVNGTNDFSVKMSDMNEWKKCTDGECEIYNMEGGHFFLFDDIQSVLMLINHKLRN